MFPNHNRKANMNKISEYFKFLREKGRPLFEINPGSDEIALISEDALEAIELLKDNHSAILGGDILSSKADKLIYAYQLWGSEYHYLNWYCNKEDNETQIDYANRSYIVARNSIIKATEVAKKIGRSCYIVLVI